MRWCMILEQKQSMCCYVFKIIKLIELQSFDKARMKKRYPFEADFINMLEHMVEEVDKRYTTAHHTTPHHHPTSHITSPRYIILMHLDPRIANGRARLTPQPSVMHHHSSHGQYPQLFTQLISSLTQYPSCVNVKVM